jgi:hypothetical protein
MQTMVNVHGMMDVHYFAKQGGYRDKSQEGIPVHLKYNE